MLPFRSDLRSDPFTQQFVVTFLFLVVGITIAFYGFYQHQGVSVQEQIWSELRDVGERRAGDITRWRQERLGDGEILRRNQGAFAELEAWLQDEHTSSGDPLLYWLDGYLDGPDYSAIRLYDAAGDVLLARGLTTPLSEETRESIARARGAAFPTLTALQFDAAAEPYLDLVVPILHAGENGSIEVAVLRVEPRAHLLPLLRGWPGSPPGARISLKREELGMLLPLLTPLAESGAERETSISLQNLLAQDSGYPATPNVQLGRGQDPRNGREVFAVVADIPDSDWRFVVAIDEAGVYAQARNLIGMAAVASLCFTLIAALALARIWRNQQLYAARRLEAEAATRAELERLHNRLQDTLQVARLGSWERNLKTGELWWSAQIRSLLAYDEQQTPTLEGFLARVHPDDRERIAQALSQAYRSGEMLESDYRAVLADGEERDYHVRVRIEADTHGSPIRVVGTLQDITEQYQAQEHIRRQRAYLLAIVNHLPQGLSVFDENLRLQYWNRVLLEVLDLPEEAVYAGAPFEDLILLPALRGEYGPGDPQVHVQKRRELALQFKPHQFERTRPNGKTHLVIGEPLEIDQRIVGFVTTYTDITERKRAEEELAKKNLLLQTIVDNVPGGLTLLDGDLQLVAYNQEVVRLLDIPDSLFDDGMPNLEKIFRCNAERGEYGPGDPEAMVAALMERARVPCAHDLERVRPNGQVIRVQGKPLPDGGFVTIYTDVTARHQAEERLLLADKVFESSPDGIVIVNPQRRILSANPAYATITGFDVPLVRGGLMRLYDGPRGEGTSEAAESREGDLWSIAAERGLFAGETTLRRADGTCFPAWLTVSAVRDTFARQTTHFVCIFHDITDRKRAEDEIQHLAHHDALTGLLNRFSLSIRLEQMIRDAQHNAERLAVLFIDLDHFKHINDSLGHHVGDGLLIEAGQRLLRTAQEGDTVARLGGDEFLVVIPHISGPSHPATVAEDLVRELSRPYSVKGHELHSTPSIGIGLYPEDGAGAEALLRHADTAMYHAKAQGRANYQFYTEEMNLRAVERLDLERKLRRALFAGEFELWFQPLVQGGEPFTLRGLEALIRWRHPEDGLIPPTRFIPLAEETGLIREIGEWVLIEACTQIARWREVGFHPPRVSVNLSPRQLLQPGLVAAVAEALQGAGIEAGTLELELTETAVMERPLDAATVLEALKALGVQLAIDDFGTGYSSLSRLKLFPLDHLKIDRSFVSDIEHDPDDAAIVAAAVSLAHSLGLSVVAEGVESAEQVTSLTRLGCDELQGYFFSRPLPASEVVAWAEGHGSITSVQAGFSGANPNGISKPMSV